MKNRILIGTGALVLAAVPAVVGLWGNASFAESVPVRVPLSGQIATASPSSSPSLTVTLCLRLTDPDAVARRKRRRRAA